MNSEQRRSSIFPWFIGAGIVTWVGWSGAGAEGVMLGLAGHATGWILHGRDYWKSAWVFFSTLVLFAVIGYLWFGSEDGAGGAVGAFFVGALSRQATRRDAEGTRK